MWREKDQIINHIISECGKLAKKEYKTKHNWVGKMIHLELCYEMVFAQTRLRRIKFFGILRYKQVTKSQRRRPELETIYQKEIKIEKEDLPYSGLCRPSEPQSDNQRK